MNKVVELVIVGAGPAGIEAALTASTAGVEVTLIDSAPSPGGQYFQQNPQGFKKESLAASQVKAQRFLGRLSSSKVTVLNHTLVWGIFEGTQPGTWCLTLHGPTAPPRLHAQAVILATGAFDRAIPFPGWDLPGVITAGAALRMIKHQRILPGKRALLSGTGPLQLQTAALMVQAGAEVVAVCECAPALLKRGVAQLPSVWGQWERIKEGLDYLNVLLQARVPYRLGWAVTAVDGEERVRQGAIQKLGPAGNPISPGEVFQEIDTVVLGYGLTPRTALVRQLGCDMEYQTRCGGFVPRRDSSLQTSRAGIYAIGDGAGLGGAEKAILEGRLAGYAVANQLGYLSEVNAKAILARDNPALRREDRFAWTLATLFSPPAGLYALADDDTVICRCEQVTLGQLRHAIAAGAQTVNDVKNLGRAGMGNCQGRTCGTIIAQIMTVETGKTVEDLRYFNIRPPIHPLPLHVIEEYNPGSFQREDRQ
jgi:NADPH-dependent 2,4-dienoyl-CoA reductase/sulfur reductase-like enzyme